MIKETLRLIGILLVLVITITGLLSLYKSVGLLTDFLLHPEAGFDHILVLLRLYQNIFLQHFTGIFLVSVFLNGLFFLNSTHLKIRLGFWKGYAILGIWGILALGILFLVNPKTDTGNNQNNNSNTVTNSSENDYRYFFKKMYEDKVSKKFLKINGEIILFSTYKNQIFTNITYLVPPYRDKQNKGIFFAHKAKLDEGKKQLVLENPFYIKNGKKKYFQEKTKVIDLTKFIDRVYGTSSFINNRARIESLFGDIMKYFPITDYEDHLVSTITKIKDNITNENTNWLFIISFICETFGILFIFAAIGILIHNKNIPALNLATSISVGVLLVIGLSFYKLPQQLMAALGISSDFDNMYGVIYLVIAIIFSILALIKFRKIQFDFGKD